MRPVIADLRARGHEVAGHRARLRPDAGAVRSLRDRAHRDRAPPRRRPARQGPRARRALAARSPAGPRARRFELALGHGSNDVTVAAALLRIPSRDDVRLRVGDRAAPRQLPARAQRRGSRRDPARAAAPLRRRRQDPRLRRASRRSTTWRTSSPTRRCSDELGLDRSRADRAWCARRRRCRSITASRTTCSRRCSTGCRGSQTVVLAAHRPSSARSSLQAGGFIVPERAIDAQSLIAYADLVVSAGGTMNREAVALGTPVLHGVRGSPGRRRRAPDRRGPAAASCTAPTSWSWSKRTDDGDSAARVRRDPAMLASLLLTAARPARKGRRQVRSGRVSPWNRSSGFRAGTRHGSATSARLPCYGAFRMLFDKLRPRLGLALAATACIAAVAAASAQAASARPIGAYTTKGAWSFVSAPKLHPPKLSTLSTHGHEQARPGLLHGRELQEPHRRSAPMVGEGGPLILDNKLQPVWFNPVGTNQLAGNLREQTLQRQARADATGRV